MPRVKADINALVGVIFSTLIKTVVGATALIATPCSLRGCRGGELLRGELLAGRGVAHGGVIVEKALIIHFVALLRLGLGFGSQK